VTSPELRAWLGANDLSRDDVAGLFDALTDQMRAEVSAVQAEGAAAWPTIDFVDVATGDIDDEARSRVLRRGCVVIRGTFDRSEAKRWDASITDYLSANRFDDVFAAAYPEAETRSRIWGVYWSPAQVVARQHPNIEVARRFLNSFWQHESDGQIWFDPTRDVGYPDRLRRREPGAAAAGLPPHCDGVVSGGWRTGENTLIFRGLLAGHADRYDPWDAAHRTDVGPPGAAPSSVFRTFQGWTALSEMHPDDGVLHAIPIPAAAAYMFVRGIAGELGLLPGDPEPAPRRFRADDLLLSAMVPIPAVEPGDTVWWHGDVIHSVAPAANATRWGNVMYIGAAPGCVRNDTYAATMLDRLERGWSPVDFPDENFEADFDGRATIADLNETGRGHFGVVSRAV